MGGEGLINPDYRWQMLAILRLLSRFNTYDPLHSVIIINRGQDFIHLS